MKEVADRPVVLCVGGHDPSGGAGILADAEAITAARVFPVTVISVVTEQDSCGLSRIYPQSAEQVEGQCRRLLGDCMPRALKIGMVGSSRVIRVLNNLIDENPDLPVILDPVLASGAGEQVVDAAMLNQLKQNLIRRSTLITPNLPEAQTLTAGRSPTDCAESLLAGGARWVLVTGTHDNTIDVTNRLFSAEGFQQTWTWPRLEAEFHGSGCTLASAIAARLALGMTMPDAVDEAQAYTWEALKRAFRIGRCQLTPNRLHALTP
ncbi:MAG: hydroxymethylpyrimidine/phosphomethylpyrimidine kinase [Thiocapsa sp.]|jgi:hydroxymethylpyrimidine/phosphomethylpyrimidine kinase|nr:hydroxymethylpyrimidine/phosphomethylpyrimidine kinase [Thiocapsa sp.]MCG6897536.1 hydroxymethylpyrimidine/phosphomethylpyrimidine kinase [Thiocapsa sp.]